MMKVTRTTMGQIAAGRRARHAEAYSASCKFETRFVNKNGSVAKTVSSEHQTREEANTRAAQLMNMNPGRTVIVTLKGAN